MYVYVQAMQQDVRCAIRIFDQTQKKALKAIMLRNVWPIQECRHHHQLPEESKKVSQAGSIRHHDSLPLLMQAK